MTEQQIKLLGALTGLRRAAEANMHRVSRDTLRAVTDGLLALKGDENRIRRRMEKTAREKNRLAPGCAVCGAPCGRTGDYRAEKIFSRPADIAAAKVMLLACAVNTARRVKEGRTDCDAAAPFLYRAVYALGMDDMSAGQLVHMAAACGTDARLLADMMI